MYVGLLRTQPLYSKLPMLLCRRSAAALKPVAMSVCARIAINRFTIIWCVVVPKMGWDIWWITISICNGMDDTHWRTVPTTCHSLPNRMMKELDRFVLTEDLPDHGLKAGDLGTIVMAHVPDGSYTGPEGYTAEFTYLTGETRAVVDLRPDQVRPAREGEVARATAS